MIGYSRRKQPNSLLYGMKANSLPNYELFKQMRLRNFAIVDYYK